MTFLEYLDRDPQYQAACKRREAAEAAICSGRRWGESRRFAGRMADNRIDRLEAARAAWSRAFDRAEKRWLKPQPL